MGKPPGTARFERACLAERSFCERNLVLRRKHAGRVAVPGRKNKGASNDRSAFAEMVAMI